MENPAVVVADTIDHIISVLMGIEALEGEIAFLNRRMGKIPQGKRRDYLVRRSVDQKQIEESLHVLRKELLPILAGINESFGLYDNTAKEISQVNGLFAHLGCLKNPDQNPLSVFCRRQEYYKARYLAAAEKSEEMAGIEA